MGNETNLSWWECVECGYTLQESMPPEKCPGCKNICVFNDVTCYTPECGGPGNIDPKLVKHKKNNSL